MRQSHVIDSWIAELGLSGRKARRRGEPGLAHASAVFEAARPGREAPHPPPARAAYALRTRYQVISSPC